MNSFFASLIFAVCLLVSSHAFMVIRDPLSHQFGPPFSIHDEQSWQLESVPKMNDVDLMAIENVAELCLQTEEAIQDGCDLDQYDALANQLQAQRAMLLDQVEYIDDLLNRLQGNTVSMLNP